MSSESESPLLAYSMEHYLVCAKQMNKKYILDTKIHREHRLG